MLVPTYWLSFHAPYACRHSGACCTSGWDIDIERSRAGAISTAVADGGLAAPAQWYRDVADAPESVAGVLERTADRCVFYRAPGCAIHTALGEAAMPAACRHFPRIALIDRRGVFVTLSHYCPTAASLLLGATDPVSIVEGPPALPGGELPEGLDARDALPPLESPRRLMDWDGYSQWEREAVAELTRSDQPEQVLRDLEPRAPQLADETLFDVACAAVPPPLRTPSFTAAPGGSLDDASAVVGRYLAAHTFAAWTAYQGNGLRCTVLYLRLVLAVLTSERARTGSLREGIRQSDLLLRHLLDPQALADRLSSFAAR